MLRYEKSPPRHSWPGFDQGLMSGFNIGSFLPHGGCQTKRPGIVDCNISGLEKLAQFFHGEPEMMFFGDSQ
ncbi:hypothetical protein C9974_12985 [Marinobacter sp. B9-2]|nr:hypothetical protein C9974_12985 [Marinobacter sp. B9-2]